jgi:hypothetical protein
MTYFHMGKPHTIIGAEWFHFRVRDGIGWDPNAVVAGRTGVSCCWARTGAKQNNKFGRVVNTIVPINRSCRIQRVQANYDCLGVIWSSLTGN